MTTIHYHEIVDDDAKYFEKMNEPTNFNLANFAIACKQSPEWVLQLLEYDILPKRKDTNIHQFFSDDLSRAQRAYRLQRDFNASLPAVAMMLDLMDEVQQLRKEMKQYHFYHH